MRRRVEKSKGAWQLKLPKGNARRELEISRGLSTLPPEFADLLFAFFRGQDPIPVAKLRTERQPHRIAKQERTLAEITLNRVTLLVDRSIRKRFTEL